MVVCRREDGLWKITQLHNQGVRAVYTRTAKLPWQALLWRIHHRKQVASSLCSSLSLPVNTLTNINI